MFIFFIDACICRYICIWINDSTCYNVNIAPISSMLFSKDACCILLSMASLLIYVYIFLSLLMVCYKKHAHVHLLIPNSISCSLSCTDDSLLSLLCTLKWMDNYWDCRICLLIVDVIMVDLIPCIGKKLCGRSQACATHGALRFYAFSMV